MRRADGREPQLRGRHPAQDAAAPRAIRGERRIGVGGVAEAGGSGLGGRGPGGSGLGRLDGSGRGRSRLLGRAVLGAVRAGGRGIRLEGRARALVPLALAREQVRILRELEDGGHEVVLARVLLEPADQVGDRDVELGGVHDGRVEEEAADVAAHRLGLTRRHPEQHLELDAGGDIPRRRQEPRVRDVEEVVSGDPDPHRGQALRSQRPLEHALVVRVGVLLRPVGRERPVVDRGVHVLHRQVRALHDAHLDRRPAGGPPHGRPLLQLLHRAERIRKIRLQHDPGLERPELRLVEQSREHRDRQVEVAVLLHVEVDELRAAGCLRPRRELVERRERADDLLHGLVERPHRQLADHAGHLDRDVVHVVAGEEVVGALEAPTGLVLAEDSLAEEVQIQAVAARAEPRDRRSEACGRGIQHQVADHGAQHPSRDRDDGPWSDRGEGSADPDGGPEVPRQEPRREGGELGETAARDPQVLGAHHPVDEPDREGEAVGILEHLGEPLRGGIDAVRRAFLQPSSDEGDDLRGGRGGDEGGGRHSELLCVADLPRRDGARTSSVVPGSRFV